MALSITTVTNSIAALSVTGVTIKDIDEIPTRVDAYDCPILYPEPIDFVTNLTVTPAAFGTGGSGPFDVEYDLTYTFLYNQVGADTELLSHYSGFVAAVCLILDKILVSDNITGCVELTWNGTTSFVAVSDPAGNIFHGCKLIFHVLEFE